MWGQGPTRSRSPTSRTRIKEANDQLARDGLRVMSFAYRTFPPDQLAALQADPWPRWPT